MADTNFLSLIFEVVIGIALLVAFLLAMAYGEIGRELPCRRHRSRRSGLRQLLTRLERRLA